MNLLTPEEAAERLAVSPKVVTAWLRQGKLPGIRLGRLWRIRPDALEKFILTGFPSPAFDQARQKPRDERTQGGKAPGSRKPKKGAPAKPGRARRRSRR